jgi:autotransporter-associated beta strand protein
VIPGSTSGTTNTDTATFGNSVVTTVLPDANRNLEFITFDGSTSAFTIGSTSGNALLMTAGGAVDIDSTFAGSNITETVDAPLTLEGDYSIANNSTNAGVSLSFGGSITSVFLAPNTKTHLTVSGPGAMTLDGPIGNGGGTVELVMSGTGTLALGGNNTFTGGVWVNSGTVVVTNASAFNSAALNYLFLVNGTFTLNGHSVTLGGLDNRGNATSPVIQNASASPATVTVVDPVNSGFDGEFPGILQDGPGGGALTLIKAGPGPMTLSGNNTFTGGLAVQNGTLSISSLDNANTVGPMGKTASVTLGSSGNIGTILLPGGGGVSSNMPFTLAAGGAGEFETLGSATLSGVISGSGGLVVSG